MTADGLAGPYRGWSTVGVSLMVALYAAAMTLAGVSGRNWVIGFGSPAAVLPLPLTAMSTDERVLDEESFILCRAVDEDSRRVIGEVVARGWLWLPLVAVVGVVVWLHTRAPFPRVRDERPVAWAAGLVTGGAAAAGLTGVLAAYASAFWTRTWPSADAYWPLMLALGASVTVFPALMPGLRPEKLAVAILPAACAGIAAFAGVMFDPRTHVGLLAAAAGGVMLLAGRRRGVIRR
ncbi:hypothetical protein Afil01_59850 [Actinorhabdospora filicis]|uniref:Uncharacterized protein n=1 Tax=Actinorhabdospora filicis TaxID=1785913 RepID=A0A9W6SSB6_9ACTN|nr:hypothetical protein [Actinorhabdospora filicis]GLZ81178.1 hypothetical protein Afil01_59850 [Actinorhabdospora filicis]